MGKIVGRDYCAGVILAVLMTFVGNQARAGEFQWLPTFPPDTSFFAPDGSSSFRGITLHSTPSQVLAVAAGLGLVTDQTTFVVAPKVISEIAICAQYCDSGATCENAVSHIYFDEHGTTLRMEFGAGFFLRGPVPTRTFADAFFSRYSIRPLVLDDDICFQDVTCFKGLTRMREQVLLLRIGEKIEISVRPPSARRKVAEDN